MDEIKKNSDESWKETVDKEKVDLKKNGKFIPPQAEFNFFITTLALQASIVLGVVEDPVSGQKKEDLAQAKFIIDTLGMLKEKTKGNLKPEESGLLENLLYELRLQYVAKTKENIPGNPDNQVI